MSDHTPDNNVVASAMASQSSPMENNKNNKSAGMPVNVNEAKTEVETPKTTSDTQEEHLNMGESNTEVERKLAIFDPEESNNEAHDKAADRSAEDAQTEFAALPLSSNNFIVNVMSTDEAFNFLGVTKDTVAADVKAAAKAKFDEGGNHEQIGKAVTLIVEYHTALAKRVQPIDRSETSTPLDSPEIVQYWANRKRLASESRQNLRSIAKVLAPSEETPDDESAIYSSMEDMDTTEDDLSKVRSMSKSVYQTPLGSLTRSGRVQDFLYGDESGPTVKAASRSSSVSGQTAFPEYDGKGWGPDEDYQSESGSIIRHSAATAANPSEDQIGTNIVDFAFKKEDGDDRSTTSSTTEVDVPVPTGRKASKSSASAGPSETGSEQPSLRGSFKFPSSENELIHSPARERRPRKESLINLDRANFEMDDEDTSGTSMTGRSSRMSYQSSGFSFKSSRFSVQSASQLLQTGPASYLDPLHHKMEPRHEPKGVAIKPRQDSLENNPYHEFMQEGTPMKKKPEKVGMRVDPQDIVYYMEQCQLIHENARLDNGMDLNHMIYDQSINAITYPEHSYLRRAILYLVAAESMTIYRPSLAEVRLSNYSMKIVSNHKEAITAAAYNLSVVFGQEPSNGDRTYLNWLRDRVRKLEADWKEVDSAQQFSGVNSSKVALDAFAPAQGEPFFAEDRIRIKAPESGANKGAYKAKAIAKVLVRSATKSQADLRESVKEGAHTVKTTAKRIFSMMSIASGDSSEEKLINSDSTTRRVH